LAKKTIKNKKWRIFSALYKNAIFYGKIKYMEKTLRTVVILVNTDFLRKYGRPPGNQEPCSKEEGY